LCFALGAESPDGRVGRSRQGEPSNIVNKSSNGRLLPANLRVNPNPPLQKAKKCHKAK
jgi:hypothetical protein